MRFRQPGPCSAFTLRPTTRIVIGILTAGLLASCGPADPRLEAIDALPYSSAQTPEPLVRRWNDEALRTIGSRINPRQPTQPAGITRCDLLAADPIDRNKVTGGVSVSEMNPRRAVRACLAAVSQDRFEPRFRYQLARAYAAAGDIDQALPILKDLSDEDYTAAKQALGQVYLQRGRALGLTNLSPAMRLLEEAAEDGSVQAKLLFGQLLIQGADGAPDAPGGLKWLQEAAADGHPLALRTVGHMLVRGGSDLSDPRLGARFLADAAELNDPESLFTLSLMRRAGIGVARDDRLALDLTRRAAEWGHPVAQAMLGGDYLGTSWVSEDLPQALFWLTLARNSGVTETADLIAYTQEKLAADSVATINQYARTWQPQSPLPDFAQFAVASSAEADPADADQASSENTAASPGSTGGLPPLEEPSFSFSSLFGGDEEAEDEAAQSSPSIDDASRDQDGSDEDGEREFRDGEETSETVANSPPANTPLIESKEDASAAVTNQISDEPATQDEGPAAPPATDVASDSAGQNDAGATEPTDSTDGDGQTDDAGDANGFLKWFTRQLEPADGREYD